MKVAFTGLSLDEGKFKYADPAFLGLVDKFKPEKVSPYYFEFMPDAYEAADAIAVTRDRLLDILIQDIEKIENRIERAEDEIERSVLKNCLEHLECEEAICDVDMGVEETSIVRVLDLLSAKPTVIVDDANIDPSELCDEIMQKSDVMFFYTAGKKEVHAWFVHMGSDAVTCAEKIHSDLARGFIKADIVSCEDMMTSHSMADARDKGLAQLVDRDFIVQPNTVLEIRFNV
jgi:ribosome-binding ATPase YchF (GTP1/OBG family)